MKKILAIAIAAVFALSSCEDFLDSENYTGANSGNFPVNVNDLNKEISALYGVMNQISTNPLTNPFFYNVILSDEINGAGGDGDTESHALGHLMATTDDYYADTYKTIYVGIARASAVLGTSESVLNSLDETPRNQLLGEAHFMRGLFYLWAVQTWGDVPAYWAVAAPDPCPQTSAENVIMPRIIEDFKEAYDLMSYNATTPGDGHATKGAAAGFLARAYMFYQGFYKKVGELAKADPAPVTVEETNFSITKQEVVACLEDAISQTSKYDLVDDFRQLWQYSNKHTAADYEFVSDLNQAGKYWAGNGNKEQMFQIQYGNMASWNGTIGMGFTNQVELYCGLRCDEAADGVADAYGSKVNGAQGTFPFGQGWGQGTVNANAFAEWSEADSRKAASVIDAVNELEAFKFTTSCTEDAGLYNKKLICVTTKATAGNDQTAGPYTWWDVERVADEKYGASSNGNCMQGSHYSDVILMRFSDILLMHSELTGDAKGLNRVHKRAYGQNVDDIPYNLTNIQNERRWEFFGEGLRFNDLRRWSGKDGGQGCLAAKALQNQDGAKVNYQGRWTTMHHGASSWAQRYAETDGFLPIPSSQIAVVNDESLLKQNKGWGSDVSDWNMTNAPAY